MSRVVELLCSRRVPQVAALALMSVGFAGCSADMRRRFRKILSPIPLPRSRKPPARCRRPRSSAASCRNMPGRSRSTSPRPCRRRSSRAAVLSGRQQRRVRRRARARVLCAAGASAARNHRHALRRVRSRRRSAPAPRRHHDHRRHQRHAGNPGAPLQCFAGRDPAGQRLRARARCRPASS